MSYIKIVGDNSKYQGKLEIVNNHIIKISGLIQTTNGFRLYLDNDELIGDYSKYTYIYDNPNLGEGVYEYSDNGVSYEEREEETKEQKEENKIREIVNEMCLDKIEELQRQLSEIQENIIGLYESMFPEEREEEQNDSIDEVDG